MLTFGRVVDGLDLGLRYGRYSEAGRSFCDQATKLRASASGKGTISKKKEDQLPGSSEPSWSVRWLVRLMTWVMIPTRYLHRQLPLSGW